MQGWYWDTRTWGLNLKSRVVTCHVSRVTSVPYDISNDFDACNKLILHCIVVHITICTYIYIYTI